MLLHFFVVLRFRWETADWFVGALSRANGTSQSVWSLGHESSLYWQRGCSFTP